MYQATQFEALSDPEPIFLLKARASIAAVQTKQSGPAQDEKYARQFRRELARHGYPAVSKAFAAQLPVMSWSDPFRSVSWNGRAPSMAFVKQWLAEEEKSQLLMRRLLFWGTMLATVAGVLSMVWGVL
jgi:hypothetical protein